MRKKIIAGNWKMNTNLKNGIELAREVGFAIDKMTFDGEKYGMIIAPPYTHLYAVNQTLSNKIGLSSQDISANEKGAYTGEISAEMVKSAGATFTILGHSERRAYFGENSEILSTKLQIALKNNLTPIFCIGEVLKERENGKQFDVVGKQIKDVLFKLNSDEFSKVIIAYEPVWAIGTGKTASPEQAQEIHAFIRNLIAEKFGDDTAQDTTILYGGSCKPANADGLFEQPDIDGGLIGGAALNANDFIKLLQQLMYLENRI